MINAAFSKGALIGMVHLQALPGTPCSTQSVTRIAAQAAAEALMLAEAGFDAILIENMHDRPYLNAPHPPEIVSAMTVCVHSVRAAVPALPLGVQILSFGHREALAVALACDAQFIRVENFVYAHVADEGLLAEAAAGPLLRTRKALNAQHIRLYCDIKKKHASHAVSSDVTIEDAAHSAEFFGADGLIVTGAFTGRPTDPSDIDRARAASSLPILVGSGVTPDQLPTLIERADGLIVGSSIKQGGVWSNPVDPQRCEQLVSGRRRLLG
jgi:membrane complex biogenesis BtpA family protein